jgi:hypothetical protein
MCVYVRVCMSVCEVRILDIDICGPSVRRMMGVEDHEAHHIYTYITYAKVPPYYIHTRLCLCVHVCHMHYTCICMHTHLHTTHKHIAGQAKQLRLGTSHSGGKNECECDECWIHAGQQERRCHLAVSECVSM